jgi:hypothetical protein
MPHVDRKAGAANIRRSPDSFLFVGRIGVGPTVSRRLGDDAVKGGLWRLVSSGMMMGTGWMHGAWRGVLGMAWEMEEWTEI